MARLGAYRATLRRQTAEEWKTQEQASVVTVQNSSEQPKETKGILKIDSQRGDQKGESVWGTVRVEDYLPASVLTDIPSPTDSIVLTPPGARVASLVGEAELLVLISSEGVVDGVLVLSSSLPTPLLEYAKASFANTRFTPGKVNATNVRSRIRFVLSPANEHAGMDPGIPFSAKNRHR